MEHLPRLFYILSAVLFIVGLKMLSSARTARKGNVVAGVGMLIAIVVTLTDRHIVEWPYIIAGFIVGGLVGVIVARRVQMTAMPQMVALFNGFGGIASTLVAEAEYILHGAGTVDVTVTMALSMLIGTVTFTGSMIAFLKLQGWMKSAPISFPGHQFINVLMLIACLALGGVLIANPEAEYALPLIGVISAILGVFLVIPIGGADMPVVISLLNSYSGLAAAMTGFVLSNDVLIVSGALVGASGIILTKIMCVAMNRSLTNVLFGKVGVEEGGPEGAVEGKTVTRYTPEDVEMVLANARSVIVVPGYGLAVAQAQHVLNEMGNLLEKRGIEVRYAIHPVAGRMPGHMNVLLAEANTSYDKIMDMESINDEFASTDVAIVVGANDVVNPAARYKKSSPLYGMPILNVDQSRTIIILKRSLRPGFAGENNELFYNDKTMMVFGDAKKTLTELVNLLKA